jgi:peptidoglycan/LPS O-acetylase OafA/YrhL
MGGPARSKFLALDGIRGVAALLIVVRHCPQFFGGIGPPETYLAVDLFFVLSGFVLAHAYSERLDQGMGWAGFMRVRLIRLYPMYGLGVLIGAAALILETLGGGPALSISTLVTVSLASILMLPCPPTELGSNLFPINRPGWSLFFELAANLVMAATWKSLNNRTLLIIMAACGALLSYSAFKLPSLDGGYVWSSLGVGYARVGFSFFAGLLIYRHRERLPALVSPWVALVASAAILCCPTPAEWRSKYDLVCILLLFPLLVVSAARREPVRGARLCAVLGVISYPLYAIHQPLQRLIADMFAAGGVDVARWAPDAGLLLAPLLAATAWLVARHYDQPIRDWLTRLFAPGGRLANRGRLASARAS